MNAARDGRDSRVAMMARAAEDGSGGQQWQRQITTAKVDDNSSRQWWQWMMMACKIGRQTTTGKDKSGQKATTAFGIAISPLGSRAVKK